MTAPAPILRDPRNLLAAAAGLYWLSALPGLGGWLCGLIPGTLLIASGVAALLWPGEGRITQYMALGGVLGVVAALPAAVLVAFWPALWALGLSVASYLLAGHQALARAEFGAAVPKPAATAKVFAKAALDEALVGCFLTLAKIPDGEVAAQMCDRAAQLEQTLRWQGWLDHPAHLHRRPPPPDDAALSETRAVGETYQWLRFSSGFTPEAALPGAAEWAQLTANRTCYAHVFRHPEPGRPWLLGIHGYRMGLRLLDLGLFPPALYYRRRGLNLVLPILPLHGPRRAGRMTGDRYLDGDLLDLVHAETQALWDLRRTIAWIRAQEPDARIGVLGYSLGGYNAALLTAYESELDFVIAGIPVADFAQALWSHIPTPIRHYLAGRGLDQAAYGRLLKPVSPLSVAPRIPAERLHLFAGSADRVVLPAHPLALAAHWQRPVHWYEGGHLTFRGEAAVSGTIAEAMAGAGWSRKG